MQEQAKEKIKALVEKYEKIKSSGKLKSYTEEETKKDLILPLLEALGWNVFDKNEVSAEEQISGDRVDYGFYLNGRIKFYLEAKKLSVDLHREDFANQSIKYSWNKGVTWAVLTDFESFKVFNAQEIDKSLSDKLLFEIPYTQYLERFDEQLSLLSKEAFEKGLIDKYAEEHGKKLQKISVSALLYKDLQKARDILTKSLAAWNEKVSKDLIDEGVQKLLDRLIFLRVAEDRGVEPQILIPMIRQWQAGGRKGSIYKSMIEKFREFDKIYNSNLFSPHPFEDWEEYDNTTEEVVNILYGKKGYYEYDFKAMPADVLGTVYENYLGYRLLQSKKGMTVDKDAKKRKEQGIYYTPTFVVDYIVKNALGPVLAECKSIADLKKIKVLDPACGSGSFLVKVLEIINDKYKDFGADGGVYTKLQILTENIYGVDLDEQAVEIARLNLLINALDSKIKLPSLAKNIKNGNSLISGADEELKKYFGKNFRDKKPFNWQEEFPEVFAQGGFDVIIGNPPYVVLGSNDIELDYFKNSFLSSQGGKINLYKLFIEKALGILKDDGRLGFICPSNYLSSADSKVLRKLLLDKTKLIEIIEYSEKGKVFANVTQALTTLVFKKTNNQKYDKFHLITEKHGDILADQKDFYKNSDLEFVSLNEIIKKIQQNKNKLSDIVEGYQGEINVSTKKEFFIKEKKENYLPLLRGNLIKRYGFLNDSLEYCSLSADTRQHWKNPRIIFQEVSNQQQKQRIKAVFENDAVLCGHTTNYCFPKDKNVDIFYILALLNSKAVNYYFSYYNKTNHVPIGEIKNIPIPSASNEQQINLAKMAKLIIDLSGQLQEIPENSNKWNSIKEEIAKTDKIIDQKVYELYGLGEEEIKIIENSGKK